MLSKYKASKQHNNIVMILFEKSSQRNKISSKIKGRKLHFQKPICHKELVLAVKSMLHGFYRKAQQL